jgi:hypothetical protein
MPENEYKTTNEKLTQQIKLLEKQLLVEKIKNQFYSQLLLQTSNLKIDKIFNEQTDGFHFYDINNSDNIHIHIHNYIKQISPNILIETHHHNIQNQNQNNQAMMLPKNDLSNDRINDNEVHDDVDDDVDEIEVDVDDDVKIIDHVNEIHNDGFIHSSKQESKNSETLDEILIQLDQNFKIFHDSISSISKSKSISFLIKIKSLRLSILNKISIHDYIQIIQEHLKKITSILQSSSLYKNDTQTFLQKSLSPLEQRLVFFPNFHTSFLEFDEIQQLQHSMSIKHLHLNNHSLKPFSYESFFKNLINYSIALSPIIAILENLLFHSPQNNNIIYIKPEKKPKSHLDNFTFYFLEKISDTNKLSWKLDCRLEDFSNLITQQLQPFIIKLFREIYFNIFHDNIYRHDFHHFSQITECESKILFQNLITIHDPISLSHLLCESTIFNSTYKIKPNDILNLKSDDALQRKKFEEHTPNQQNILQIIKILFDNISNEDAKNYLNLFQV